MARLFICGCVDPMKDRGCEKADEERLTDLQGRAAQNYFAK